MISLQKLFGKDDSFFDLLESSAAEALSSAQILSKLLKGGVTKADLNQLQQFRRRENELRKETAERLVKTYVTAIEREDIEALSNALYKIPKTIEKIAERISMAAQLIKPGDFTRHSPMVEQAAEHVVAMIKLLRRGAHLEEIKECNGRLQQVEGDADKLMLALLKELYSGKDDPIRILALKELYELLEKVIDRCRDAGNVMTQVALKNS